MRQSKLRQLKNITNPPTKRMSRRDIYKKRTNLGYEPKLIPYQDLVTYVDLINEPIKSLVRDRLIGHGTIMDIKLNLKETE